MESAASLVGRSLRGRRVGGELRRLGLRHVVVGFCSSDGSLSRRLSSLRLLKEGLRSCLFGGRLSERGLRLFLRLL